jgi:hypothetical protein
MSFMEVELYPDVDLWLAQVQLFDVDVYVEVVALIDAVRSLGRSLGDPESHPVVTSKHDMHALRRTPPSATAPYADRPPVIRILYAFCRRTIQGETIAVVLIGGDKTVEGNRWYPPNIAEAERRLLIYSGQHKLTPLTRKR